MSYCITIFATLAVVFVFFPGAFRFKPEIDCDAVEAENKRLKQSLLLNASWRKDLALKALKKIQDADPAGVELIVRRTLQNIARLQLASGDYYIPPIFVNMSFLVRQECEKLGIIENVSIDPDITGMGGAIKIASAIHELLMNALEAGDSEPYVMLRKEDEYTVLTIRNRGQLQDTPDQLMTMYYSFKDGGEGLGLAMARTVAEKHEGSLTIAQQKNYVETTMRIKI